MLPQQISTEIKKIDARLKVMAQGIDSSDSLVQGIFSAHLVIAGAGLVEQSVIQALSEYGRRHGDGSLSRYVQRTVARNNSLNCKKIEDILDHFNKEWWPGVVAATTEVERSSVNSLKTLRDSVAHGGSCQAGFSTAKEYYRNAKGFVENLCNVVLS